MTSFYSWRLMFLTFYGTSRAHGHGHDAHGHGHDAHGHGDHGHEPHESPKVMLIPLGVLALGAVFSGMVWYNSFFGDEAKMRAWFGMEPAAKHAEGAAKAGDHAEGGATAATEGADSHATASTATEAGAAPAEGHATSEAVQAEGHSLVPGAPPKGAIFIGPDNHVIHAAHEAPKWVKVSPFVAMLLGLALAYQMYIRRPDWPARLAAQQRPLYQFLLNKWYFDELYDAVLVGPAKWLGGFLWKKGDGAVIDGSINGVALGIIPFFTRLAGRAQSGYIFHYAFAMVLGIVVLVTWMTLSGGAQ
jgi:NADH-quinone oxidoreductase subunit L